MSSAQPGGEDGSTTETLLVVLVMVFFLVVLLLVCPLGPLGLADGWQSDCSSSRSNDLKTSALLYAHRCYLKVRTARVLLVVFYSNHSPGCSHRDPSPSEHYPRPDPAFTHRSSAMFRSDDILH